MYLCKSGCHDKSDGSLLPVQNMQDEVNCGSHAVRKVTQYAGEIKNHRR